MRVGRWVQNWIIVRALSRRAGGRQPPDSPVTFDDGMNHANAGRFMSNDRQSVFAEKKSPKADAPRLAETDFFVSFVVFWCS